MFDRAEALREGASALRVLGKPAHIHPAFNANPGKTHKDPRYGQAIRFAAKALELAARASKATERNDVLATFAEFWTHLLHGEPDPIRSHPTCCPPRPSPDLSRKTSHT